jgi:DNA-binding transcriptional MerR regulator
VATDGAIFEIAPDGRTEFWRIEERCHVRLTVHQIAERADTTSHAVRYYARIGLLEPERDPGNGYKLFAGADVERLRFIRRAKRLGFRLTDIADMLRDSQRGNSPCPRARRLINRRIEENRLRIAELVALQERMERARDAWERMPDVRPDGSTVCHLIESIGMKVDGIDTDD